VTGERDPAQDRRASWPPILQFVWDVLGDRERYQRAAPAFRVVAALAFLIVLLIASLEYEAMLHGPTWAKIAVPAGSVTITLGGALFRRRRVELSHADPGAEPLPGEGPPGNALPEVPPQEGERDVGGPGEQD